jgi:small subunit ribosomal protein S17
MVRGAFGGRKTREGTVVSDKMDKTVVVAVATSTRHRLYKKIVRRLRRYNAHDETNDAKLGDRVRIVESRAYSRHKRWQLADVLIRVERPEVAAEEIDLELLGEVKREEEEVASPPEAAADQVTPESEAAEPEAKAEPDAEVASETLEEPGTEAEPKAEASPEASPEALEEPEIEAEPKAEATTEADEEQSSERNQEDGSS